MERANYADGEVYICPHTREAFLRDARQNGRDPFGNLGDVGDIVNNAQTAGETASRVGNAALNAAGFTRNGVRANSLASSYQSRIGRVSRGSTFSSLQRTGNKGGLSSSGGIAIGVAAVAAIVTIGVSWWRSTRDRMEEEEQLQRRLEELARANGGRLLCDACRRREEEIVRE